VLLEQSSRRHGTLPAARIIRPVDLDELRDAENAASAAAKVIANANSGEIDMEAGKFLLDAIDKFAHLYERQQLEERVMQLEAAASKRSALCSRGHSPHRDRRGHQR
jgi:hypothetical protein